MTDAPNTIYAWDADYDEGHWSSDENRLLAGETFAYIRKDLSDASIKALEAENERLRAQIESTKVVMTIGNPVPLVMGDVVRDADGAPVVGVRIESGDDDQ